MRLIDADEFKKQIAAVIVRDNLIVEKGNAMCELIDRQPTAYDVDEVVKKLKERKSLLMEIVITDKDFDVKSSALCRISEIDVFIKCFLKA